MKRFAQQNRVLFINSITMGLPSVSNADFFLKIRRKLRSQLRWLRKAPEGVYVLTPLVLPFYRGRFVRYLNRVFLTAQIRLAMAICRMQKAIVWAAIPSAADVVDRLGAKLVVCQVSDKYDANEDSSLSRQVIRELDQRLKRKAAVVWPMVVPLHVAARLLPRIPPLFPPRIPLPRRRTLLAQHREQALRLMRPLEHP